jgi:hypothetical protein
MVAQSRIGFQWPSIRMTHPCSAFQSQATCREAFTRRPAAKSVHWSSQAGRQHAIVSRHCEWRQWEIGIADSISSYFRQSIQAESCQIEAVAGFTFVDRGMDQKKHLIYLYIIEYQQRSHGRSHLATSIANPRCSTEALENRSHPSIILVYLKVRTGFMGSKQFG